MARGGDVGDAASGGGRDEAATGYVRWGLVVGVVGEAASWCGGLAAVGSGSLR